ncbi:hypothetical protein RclHR1_12680011 [Rhizophagus clarus]|uniref:Uncharacterized protein n=1 Tax=Rhizophagus clarus TaxID=94130 RepID=A0A2Z6Q9M3_9GLOM|nr:hypothetical protein RclHR1_12680011 [Rhizophagus clarus]
MKTGHRHYTVKALIDTSSRANKISKSLTDRLGKKYGRELSKSDSTEFRKRVKKLEQTVDWIGTYVEKQTGLEAGKELTDSSESSLAEEAYTIEELRESNSDNMPPIIIKRKIHNENKKSDNKTMKPRRNPIRACKNN